MVIIAPLDFTDTIRSSIKSITHTLQCGWMILILQLLSILCCDRWVHSLHHACLQFWCCLVYTILFPRYKSYQRENKIPLGAIFTNTAISVSDITIREYKYRHCRKLSLTVIVSLKFQKHFFRENVVVVAINK